MRHIIVGIDTGKASSIAGVDLNGRVIGSITMKYVGIRWFVDKIKELGSPVIIATDKKRANQTVAKLAAIFDSVLFTPKYDISVEKKDTFLSNNNVSTLHERDALTAAITAYNAYSNKLNQIERMARKNNIEYIDEIKALVIKKSSFKEACLGIQNGRFIR
jgi:predicted RNase H-like nuclease (RuvC/YqgF family)